MYLAVIEKKSPNIYWVKKCDTRQEAKDAITKEVKIGYLRSKRWEIYKITP